MNYLDDMATRFAETFDQARPEVVVRAPGRVNLIGEHIDYNDGFVLPIAMTQALYLAGRRRDDRRLIVHTTAFDETADIDLDDPGPPGVPKWANYVKGVAALLIAEGVDVPGCELSLHSEVPLGGGVSSSAALEVGTAGALLALAGAELEPIRLAMLARQAEHEYANSPCGIMDQFICVLGRQDHALLLDCRDQSYEHVPAALAGAAWVVMDTQVKHELGESEYPVRQRQCREGLARLQQVDPGIVSLRDATPEMLAKIVDETDPVVVRRCCHVVTEIERTTRAADALRQADKEAFGRAMLESHASLRDDYEVSCNELDALVAVASTVDGVYGARMTGGGFGGCAIALVDEDALEPLAEALRERYSAGHAKPALAYTTQPSAGMTWQRV